MSQLSRRRFLFNATTAAAGTFIIHGCTSENNVTTTTTEQPPTTTTTPVVTSDNAPETNKAKLGFIALTDSAPLIIAQEKGFFAKYGMTEVEVLKQASWPVTRDNLELGSGGGGIDGAHILTPMPYLMTLGTITQQPLPMYILARLNVNGQAISVSNNYQDLKVGLDSSVLKDSIAQLKSSGKEPTFAMTFPGGTHDLWMRYWLAAGGIDPTTVSVVPIPPPQMVANMKVGTMEAFCVGEPWNAQLVNQKEGFSALVTGQLWNNHPEKAFSMRKDWVDQNPKATKALLMAVLEAQKWCDNPENIEEMCTIVSQDKWFKVPIADILPRAQGTIDFGNGVVEENFPYAMKFWSDYASYPFQSHDLWFLIENIRWGSLPANTDTQGVIAQVNREDLWREAATTLGVPETEIPTSTSRGVEEFFDGIKFDPENPQAYLDSLKIKKV